MGRKLNLSHLTEEECERILHVLQKDFEVRQAEKERIETAQGSLRSEQNKTHVLSQQAKFNKNCCMRCCQVFGLIFNRRRQCYNCGYNVCKDCCELKPDSKKYLCHFCNKEKDLAKQSCSWFYTSVGHKFRRFGSAKVVRSLYRTTSYSDTELDTGYHRPGVSRATQITSRKRRARLPAEFRNDNTKEDDDDSENDEEDDDDAGFELPATRTASLSSSHGVGGRPPNRAASLDSLHRLSSSSFTAPEQTSRTLDPSKPPARASKSSKPAASDPDRACATWDDAGHDTTGKTRTGTKDVYRQAFESARQAEEHKFKEKFNVLLNNLHRTLDLQSPHGLAHSFASTSYGEVMLSFRGQVKDLLIDFTQRLQLAYESFESQDLSDDHTHEVRQFVSQFLEDLLGEPLDINSDEAVSDLSSLSDDSANDRHTFEDQIAQAVVSRILDNHRREVHHSLRHGYPTPGRSGSPLSHSESDDNEVGGDEQGRRSRVSQDAAGTGTDISKDFEDLKQFVEKIQSRAGQRGSDRDSGDCTDEDGEVEESGEGCAGRNGGESSSVDTLIPPPPDFSQFDQIDFNSEEVDPDLIQMNLAIIPEETEEELEEEAVDTHWRENWIFKGQAPSAHESGASRRFKEYIDQPQYLMVPRPDDDLAPKVGNKDADQLSDLSDNLNDGDSDLTDDETSFYPRTSEELARIARHKRSLTPPTLTSPSLIPTLDPFNDHDDDDDHNQESNEQVSSSSHTLAPSNAVDQDMGGTKVGTSGPIVEKSRKELKLLEELVPAEDDDPKFVVLPESVTVQEGQPVKFSCRVSGTQPIDVFWYREHDGVEELEEGEDVELHVEGDRHHVTLYNVDRQLSGQYMCIALSDKGKAIKYVTVTVKENKQELKKPEFLKELKDVEVFEGQNVKFRCKVKGYPQPRINWYKDGNLLKGSKTCRIEKFGNRDYILTIDYATMDDDAEYMVVARNVAGQVRSTAQVIVEPYTGQPMLPTSRSLSVSSVYTDSGSERLSSVTSDSLSRALSMDSVTPRSRSPHSDDTLVDSLVDKVTVTRDYMRQEAEDMVTAADELTVLNHQLEDMERHLDNIEGRNSHPATNPAKELSYCDNCMPVVDEVTALATIKEEAAMTSAARNIRKLTSNALSVLRAAEEIIQNEKHSSGIPASTSTPRAQEELTSYPCFGEENNSRSVSVSLVSDMSQSDLNQSVSSGYGTLSMASSAIDDNGNDSVMAGSTMSFLDCQDDLALLDLPALDDDGLGSYREEVSIHLSSKASSRPTAGRPSGASSSSSSTVTNSSSSSSSSSNKTVKHLEATSTAHTPAGSDVSEQWPSRAGSTQEPEQIPGVSNCGLPDMSELEDKLVLNFGPKERDVAAYARDYEVGGPQTVQERTAKGCDRTRWSVKLNPYSAAADVVNRQPNLEETEEQIYLTSGKMFNLEHRVKELQSRLDSEGNGSSVHSLTDLEDQVARTAAQVASTEKEVSGIERAVNTLQFSPRSSGRGSNSSGCSTPRESIDSGVSSFTQERSERTQSMHLVGQTFEEEGLDHMGLSEPLYAAGYSHENEEGLLRMNQETPDRMERPKPVHMIGQTQEEEVPESRAEYDADSGIELPSVSRLRAMFGKRGRDNDQGDGSFTRKNASSSVHSITARSLTQKQLQTLEAAGNTTLRTDGAPAQSPSSIQLSEAADPGSGFLAPPSDRSSRSSLSISLTPSSGQQQQQSAKRQIRATQLPEPAMYQMLSPTNDPVLIFPELDEQSSASPRGSSTPVASAVNPLRSRSPTPSRLPVRSASPASKGLGGADGGASPVIRSGCISARAAFWERRILQEEATDDGVEEDFPEMVQESHA